MVDDIYIYILLYTVLYIIIILYIHTSRKQRGGTEATYNWGGPACRIETS